MSLFGKAGMTTADALAVMGGLKALAEAVAERLKDHDAEIAKLKAEISKLNADKSPEETTTTMMVHPDSFDLGKAYAFKSAEYTICFDTSKGEDMTAAAVYRNVPGQPTALVASATFPPGMAGAEIREQCAQVVEAMGMQGYGTLAIAAAIRRGKV